MKSGVNDTYYLCLGVTEFDIIVLNRRLPKVLKFMIDTEDIKIRTDGYTFYPYYYKNVLFVSQFLSTSRKIPFEIYMMFTS